MRHEHEREREWGRESEKVRERKSERQREKAKQPHVRFRADETKKRGGATMCGSTSHNNDNLKTILISSKNPTMNPAGAMLSSSLIFFPTAVFEACDY